MESLFGDIKGQLNAAFRKESITQLKLTAFIPLANDMLKLIQYGWNDMFVL